MDKTQNMISWFHVLLQWFSQEALSPGIVPDYIFGALKTITKTSSGTGKQDIQAPALLVHIN